MLTAERLRELLDYDPETGVFRWRVRRGSAHTGRRAGTPGPKGSLVIRVDRILHLAHRLAWLWMTGEWPAAMIDHVDLKPANNKWSNLRSASSAQNNWNTGARRHNSIGAKEVHFDKARGKYRAQIQANKYPRHLGYFGNLEDAAAAYISASRSLHGAFARV